MYNLHLMIHISARGAKAPMVEYLFQLGNRNNIPYRNLFEYPEIHAAIKNNSMEVFQKFIDVHPECANFHMDRLGNPLTRVIGFMVDEEDNAAPEIETNFVKFLLERGANPNSEGSSPGAFGNHLASAAAKGTLEVVDMLLQYGSVVLGSGAFQQAIFAERIGVMELLFEHGADLNESYPLPAEVFDSRESYDTTFATPLHFAIEAGSTKAAAWLIEHGADMNIRDSFGRTPMDIVVSIHSALGSARDLLHELKAGYVKVEKQIR